MTTAKAPIQAVGTAGAAVEPRDPAPPIPADETPAPPGDPGHFKPGGCVHRRHVYVQATIGHDGVNAGTPGSPGRRGNPGSHAPTLLIMISGFFSGKLHVSSTGGQGGQGGQGGAGAEGGAGGAGGTIPEDAPKDAIIPAGGTGGNGSRGGVGGPGGPGGDGGPVHIWFGADTSPPKTQILSSYGGKGGPGGDPGDKGRGGPGGKNALGTQASSGEDAPSSGSGPRADDGQKGPEVVVRKAKASLPSFEDRVNAVSKQTGIRFDQLRDWTIEAGETLVLDTDEMTKNDAVTQYGVPIRSIHDLAELVGIPDSEFDDPGSDDHIDYPGTKGESLVDVSATVQRSLLGPDRGAKLDLHVASQVKRGILAHLLGDSRKVAPMKPLIDLVLPSVASLFAFRTLTVEGTVAIVGKSNWGLLLARQIVVGNTGTIIVQNHTAITCESLSLPS